MTFRVDHHQELGCFDTLAGEWNALLRRAAVDTLFLTPLYKRTWWRHLGEGELHLLAARRQDELLGVAPLFIVEQGQRGRVVQTVGCVEVSDYLDWVAARGQEEDVLAALLDFLGGPAAPAWDALDLCNVHRDSPTLRLLPELARARGWTVETEVQEVCPIVDLPSTWDDYLALLGRKDRHELRRKMRRAEATPGLSWHIVGPPHDLDAALDDFLLLMAKSNPEKAAFLTPRLRAFFRELAHVTFEAGWLQLSLMQLGDAPLASYLNFAYHDRVMVYNSGLDWQADPGFGAGIVLTGYLIQHAIEQGYRVYDFLRGDEPYKYRFGGQDVTVHRILIQRVERKT